MEGQGIDREREKEKEKEKEVEQYTILLGFFIFGVVGFAASSYAMYSRLQSFWKGASRSSFRTTFQKEPWKRYNKRLQEECKNEMDRVERIRRMQSAFNNKYNRSYENWRENGPRAYHQHFERDDWYWKANASSFKDHRTNYRDTPRESGYYSLSHHYSVLGLDRCRTTPYSDAEIKKAFRTKAKQYHPDQNQDSTEAAEAKFKEVMSSYEAIQKERKNQDP